MKFKPIYDDQTIFKEEDSVLFQQVKQIGERYKVGMSASLRHELFLFAREISVQQEVEFQKKLREGPAPIFIPKEVWDLFKGKPE